MSTISLIAAVDENNGIGKDNHLLCHLPVDLQHFKKITMGKPIIMGSKTWLSIGKPLPGRQNIVLSHHLEYIDGVEIATSLAQALELAREAPEIMIIGGAQLFREALPLASCIYLSVIHHCFEADVFFPQLDETVWQRERIGFYKKDLQNPYDVSFYKFTV